jgi:hypothetical protein
VQTKEKDKEREKEEKRNNDYLLFSAAAEGEHIHTLIHIVNTESKAR